MNTINEPTILSANTYFWTAGGNASTRRRNEDRHLNSVADYLSAIGFTCRMSDDAVTAECGDTIAVFGYSESCANVYKSLSVTRAGRKSNISAIRKIAAAYEATNAIAA